MPIGMGMRTCEITNTTPSSSDENKSQPEDGPGTRSTSGSVELRGSHGVETMERRLRRVGSGSR
jgi:hypothetical protein